MSDLSLDRRHGFRCLLLVALLVALSAQGQPTRLRSPRPVPDVVSARVEAVARAICRAKGIDPDHVGAPYPQGAVWQYFIPQAIEFLDEYDAVVHFLGPDVPIILPPPNK